MDETTFKTIQKQIDYELANRDEHIGIAFGLELYKEFGQRGLLTQETFSVSGTGAFPIEVMAYHKSHNAIASWELDELAYKVGSR